MRVEPSFDIDELPKTLSAFLTLERARALVDSAMGEGRELLESAFGRTTIKTEVYCRALVAFFGWDILGSRDVRQALVERASDTQIDRLFEFLESENVTPGRPVSQRATKLARVVAKQWRPGGSWSRLFVDALGLPLELAQKNVGRRLTSVEVFEKRLQLGELHEYQRELYDTIVSFLSNDAKQAKRAMVSLPTGAGKTRVIVECLADLIRNGKFTGPILWVAQTEELCEQAVKTLGHVWNGRLHPPPYDLVVQRVWGGLSDDVDFSVHAIVTTPESFNAKVSQFSIDRSTDLAGRIAAIVIDEAHLALAKEYSAIFDLGDVCCRVIGLTATPGRSRHDEALRLVRKFCNVLLTPNLLAPEPILALTESKVLAEAVFSPVPVSGDPISLSPDEAAHFAKFKDYSPAVLKRIGKNQDRNRQILHRLLAIDSEKQQTLVFASSVASARWLAGTMSALGRSAAVVDSQTARPIRSSAIDHFNRGSIQFLFNYQVLAQGFDAPKVANVVIARPVNSVVLMEQMLGRGLRGPLNGGTDVCNIIYFEDNFEENRHRPRGYANFIEYWNAWSDRPKTLQ